MDLWSGGSYRVVTGHNYETFASLILTYVERAAAAVGVKRNKNKSLTSLSQPLLGMLQHTSASRRKDRS